MICGTDVISADDIDNNGRVSCAAAKQILAKLYQANAAVGSGQSYRWGDRQLTMTNAKEIRDATNYWRNEVKSLCGGVSTGPVVRAATWPEC